MSHTDEHWACRQHREQDIRKIEQLERERDRLREDREYQTNAHQNADAHISELELENERLKTSELESEVITVHFNRPNGSDFICIGKGQSWDIELDGLTVKGPASVTSSQGAVVLKRGESWTYHRQSPTTRTEHKTL